MSSVGIPFGFGLSQVPAIVTDAFGIDKYGFAFGIAHIGSIAASAATMPVFNVLSTNGIMVAIMFAGLLHAIIGGLILTFVKNLNEEYGPLVSLSHVKFV
jgi:hypothetical protein